MQFYFSHSFVKWQNTMDMYLLHGKENASQVNKRERWDR